MSLALDTSASEGIDTSVWPSEIGPNTNVPTFAQGWNFQIKFVAVYVRNDNPIGLDFYADGVQVFDCKVESNPDTFQGSSANQDGPFNVFFTIAD